MGNLFRVLVVFFMTFLTLSSNLSAQTVAFNGVGSSALFLATGLGASSPTTGLIHATCVWSTAATGVVVATDTSTGGSLQDSGSAWVAWNPPSGLSPTPANCAMVNSLTLIYAYLQTDSVAGVRCLFNACTIQNNGSGVSPDGLILGASEVPLPSAITTTLNGSSGNGLVVTAAATDIRPEDAAFATARALTPCGTAVATGSQYLGLGYTNGDTIDSHFNTASIHVANFTLPANPINYAVTPIGATPILVIVNGNGSTDGFSDPSITNISSDALSKFLDGTYSYTGQANATPTASGDPATVILREPLAGDYNTMEHNVPNNLTLETSQDVGLFQPFGQVNCTGTTAMNPMNIATKSGGARQRAVSTAQELAEVMFNQNSLGYAFWNTANFQHLTSGAAPFAKYLTVDGIDPLITVSSSNPHTGIIPTTAAELDNVTLSTTANGSYPIWSLLRLVTAGSTTAPTAVTTLSAATQDFVVFGSDNPQPTSPRPDFITVANLQGVRSHFVPPLPAPATGTTNGQPNPAADGHVGSSIVVCSNPEQGGDVGGVFIKFATDAETCARQPAGGKVGGTGQRR